MPSYIVSEIQDQYKELNRGDLELLAIEALAKSLKVDSPKKYNVGRCDLINVYPRINGPGKAGNPDIGYKPGRSVLKLYSARVQGENNFYYLGKRQFKTEDLCIIPDWSRLIPSPRVRNLEGSSIGNRACEFSEGLGVGVNPGRAAVRSALRSADDQPLVTHATFAEEVAVGPAEKGVSVVVIWTGAGQLEHFLQ